MSKQVLEKLFDSPVKLRVLKLFLRNPKEQFKVADVRKRLLVRTPAAKRELDKLYQIKLLNRSKKKRQYHYSLNKKFTFINELENLILKSSPADEQKMAKKIRDLGRVKLAVLTGLFTKPDRENARTDLLVVGNNLNDRKLNTFVRNLEAEAGTEIFYTVLDTDEFEYRNKMFDRFLLDIFEKPHKKLIDKLDK